MSGKPFLRTQDKSAREFFQSGTEKARKEASKAEKKGTTGYQRISERKNGEITFKDPK